MVCSAVIDKYIKKGKYITDSIIKTSRKKIWRFDLHIDDVKL